MAHLSNKTDFGKQRPWCRIDGYGQLICGTMVFRDTPPKNGTWVQIGSIDQCCNPTGNSYIVFQNTTGSANITSIVSNTGVNWTGTLTNATGVNTIVFSIPGGIDASWIITTTTFSGRTITNTVTQNLNSEGSITSPGALSADITTFSTSGVPNIQYLSILS